MIFDPGFFTKTNIPLTLATLCVYPIELYSRADSVQNRLEYKQWSSGSDDGQGLTSE